MQAFQESDKTYGMMVSAIWVANFPTLVPPYFWTSHFAAGSIVFWCMFGGVRGALDDDMEGERDEDADVEGGVDAADMIGEADEFGPRPWRIKS